LTDSITLAHGSGRESLCLLISLFEHVGQNHNCCIQRVKPKMMGLEKMSRIWSRVKCGTALSSRESRKDAEKRSPLTHSFITGFVSHLYSLPGFPPPALNHSGLNVLLWRKHAIVNWYILCITKCNSWSFSLWQYQTVLIYPWSLFFLARYAESALTSPITVRILT